MMKTENQTPAEKFDAITNLSKKLYDNYIQLGQLLSEIKRQKLFRLKGYENFKEFLSSEYSMSQVMANKLIRVYSVFSEEMGMDDETLKQIGLDRLLAIAPMMQKASLEAKEEWMAKAESLTLGELQSEIKTKKAAEKNKDLDLKDVLISQYLEKMRTWFNCSAKELNFKLALYFQDADLEAMRTIIKERQRKFETELAEAHHEEHEEGTKEQEGGE